MADAARQPDKWLTQYASSAARSISSSVPINYFSQTFALTDTALDAVRFLAIA